MEALSKEEQTELARLLDILEERCRSERWENFPTATRMVAERNDADAAKE